MLVLHACSVAVIAGDLPALGLIHDETGTVIQFGRCQPECHLTS